VPPLPVATTELNVTCRGVVCVSAALVAATETGVSDNIVSYHHTTGLTEHIRSTHLQQETVFGASHLLGESLVLLVSLVPFLLIFS
jgi:hypothetical protein